MSDPLRRGDAKRRDEQASASFSLDKPLGGQALYPGGSGEDHTDVFSEKTRAIEIKKCCLL